MKFSLWLLLGSLYVTQFLPVAFFFMGLPVILRAEGMALERIGALYVLGFVWVLKLLWAPLVDRVGAGRRSHYRSWLLGMQGAMVVMLVVLSAIDPVADFGQLVPLALVMTVFAATQDVATDALACKLLPPALRGIGNGIQISGGLVGMILGGGVMLHVYAVYGWEVTLFGLAAVVALVMIQIACFDEAATSSFRVKGHKRAGFARLWRLWTQPGMGQWALVLLSLPAGISIVFALLPPMLVDSGWDVAATGTLLNVIGPIAGILSALGTGGLIRRFGARLMLPLAPLLQIVAMAVLLPLATGIDGDLAVLGGVLLVFAAHNIVATITVTLMMARVGAGTEGSDFTSQHSIYLLMGFVSGGLALQLAAGLGYVTAIYIAAAAALTAALLSFGLRRRLA